MASVVQMSNFLAHAKAQSRRGPQRNFVRHDCTCRGEAASGYELESFIQFMFGLLHPGNYAKSIIRFHAIINTQPRLSAARSFQYFLFAHSPRLCKSQI